MQKSVDYTPPSPTHEITHICDVWDPFLRVCFEPQNSNIHPRNQSSFQ